MKKFGDHFIPHELLAVKTDWVNLTQRTKVRSKWEDNTRVCSKIIGIQQRNLGKIWEKQAGEKKGPDRRNRGWHLEKPRKSKGWGFDGAEDKHFGIVLSSDLIISVQGCFWSRLKASDFVLIKIVLFPPGLASAVSFIIELHAGTFEEGSPETSHHEQKKSAFIKKNHQIMSHDECHSMFTLCMFWVIRTFKQILHHVLMCWGCIINVLSWYKWSQLKTIWACSHLQQHLWLQWCRHVRLMKAGVKTFFARGTHPIGE